MRNIETLVEIINYKSQEVNMTAKANDHDVKVSEKASEVARKIWLAGLGAYGRAFDGASEQMDKLNEQYEKVSKQTNQLFDELVAKGKVLDEESHEKLTDAKDKTTQSVEDRISKVKDTLNFSVMNGSSSEIAELNKKIDALTKKVDALLDKKSPSKTSSRKTGTRKSASSAS
jgi:poly(hydroxyalkanoate) granule-associated protein